MVRLWVLSMCRCDCTFILGLTELCEGRRTVLHTKALLCKYLVRDSVIGLFKDRLLEACTLFLRDFRLAGPVHPTLLVCVLFWMIWAWLVCGAEFQGLSLEASIPSHLSISCRECKGSKQNNNLLWPWEDGTWVDAKLKLNLDKCVGKWELPQEFYQAVVTHNDSAYLKMSKAY